jgi:hypothetical protein
MQKRCFPVQWFVTLVLCATLTATAAAAQRPPDPCTGKKITCPTPWATNSFVLINLEQDSDSICRFNPRVIEDLKIDLGGNVQWSFCNACSMNMDVEISTGPGGPFDHFRSFFPFPTADNLVTVPVDCKDTAGASGFSALRDGEWKYNLRARPSGTLTFPDAIDPRLEIDDRTLTAWLPCAGLALVGAGLGYGAAKFLSMRRDGTKRGGRTEPPSEYKA